MHWEQIKQSTDHKMPVIVSYYTDEYYRKEAYDLARSCQQFNMDYWIEQIADRGSWLANTNYKPTFLLSIAAKFPGRAILWVDADARVRARPIFVYGLDATISFHTWHGRPASGTVYLSDCKKERSVILSSWEAECLHSPHSTDQVCMGFALKKTGVAFTSLPVEYCWIFDFDPTTQQRLYSPVPEGNPVIEHMQSSRFTRNR